MKNETTKKAEQKMYVYAATFTKTLSTTNCVASKEFSRTRL